ncbi:hypothetical protein Bca4012_057642 [Brassica carinata]|uniref:Uncharacterized protein n=1 Tax=Brassica carinata TaxID=52824 RepID=A0A8X8B2R3_BRACI|nr:hypothetical protein Bca52824_014927 [Brassica carinata]
MDREGAGKNKKLKAVETEKTRVSLAEVAAKMDPSNLEDYLYVPSVPDMDVLRFYFYFEKAFAQVSFLHLASCCASHSLLHLQELRLTTKRFEAIYPLLKEVVLSPERAGGGRYAMKRLFTFALTITGEKGNPVVLTKEATSIAIRSLTENVYCFEHWDKIYMHNPEACVALLKKLVDEWNSHFHRLSTSPSDTLTCTVNQTMESFRRKELPPELLQLHLLYHLIPVA